LGSKDDPGKAVIKISYKLGWHRVKTLLRIGVSFFCERSDKVEKYNKLRKRLFDLRIKQSLSKSEHQEELLQTEKEILDIKKEMASLMREFNINEKNIGGRKK